MKLIILTGYSGCGKSTMLNYAKSFWLENVDSVDTGDLFKAILAMSKKGELNPHKVLTDLDALSHFVSNKLGRGVYFYEELKISGEISGTEIIYFIETLRALCPDLPSRWVYQYSQIVKPDVLVTTAINDAELNYLVNWFEKENQIEVIALKCSNPVVRDGDNRAPVEEHSCDRTFRYELKQSLEVMHKILFG